MKQEKQEQEHNMYKQESNKILLQGRNKNKPRL
jgi:hypothetical protein